MTTIGVVANIYNEALALPGWLEAATAFFDDVRVVDASPGEKPSDDGTVEILEKWRIKRSFGYMREGFGTIRTWALHWSPCDWVVILDADERFWQFAPVLHCEGESPVPPVEEQVLQHYDTPTPGCCPWNHENAGSLRSQVRSWPGDIYNQGAWLRSIIEDKSLDAVMAIRRQWTDFTWRRPSQNWHTHPDHQIRIVRRREGVRWSGKLHETLGDTIKNVYQPNTTHGPFLDHYHLPFKAMNPEQRKRDIDTYQGIYAGF